MDIDGAIKFSSLLTVKKTSSYAPAMTITPSPSMDNIIIHIASDIASPCEIKVVNAAGVVIYQSKAALVRGENQVYINKLPNITSGMYIVQATIGNNYLTKKIIINR